MIKYGILEYTEMMSFSQMLMHFVTALVLGGIMGMERERVGKEAGIRTSMMVAGGAALFTIAGLSLPYFVATSPENLPQVIAANSGFLIMIANIVVGIGFLGAGIIIKTEEHVHGLTTAAVIWTTAAIGILAGIGLTKFALAVTIISAGSLYVLRRVGIYEKVRPRENNS